MIKSIKKISKKHYIQCGLAILLTGLVLYFTSALWSNKAVIVSFNAEAKKEIQCQVFYTEANGQGFNEKQSVKKPIKSGNQKVEILLPIERIVKIRLDIDSNPGDVVISDLQVKGSKNVKLNYNEFNKNQIDKYEVKDGKLYITSNEGDPYLSYKQELNLFGGVKVDWCGFIIISVLAFLLMYKFVQYLSKFKIEKQHSRIDILMLAVFFALLFLPMSHISDAKKSEQENRMLAKKPQLTIDGGGYNNYGVQFDAWYNDHFFGRDAMMDLYRIITFNLDKYYSSSQASMYRDGWLLGNGELYSKISENELHKIRDGIVAYKLFCESNNIKCYIEIVPRKLEFMKEYQFKNIIEKDKAQIVEEYVSKYADFKIIYPLNELKQANKSDLVYFKTDHHWTDFGAFIGYQELMKAIKEDYPSLHILYENDFNISYSKKVRAEVNHSYGHGQTCKLLNLGENDCLENTDYKYYTNKRENELKISTDKFRNKDFYASYAQNEQKVMIIGNSFAENIAYFFASSFKNVLKRRCNNQSGNDLKLSRWKDEIIKSKIDILIIVIQSDFSSRLQNLIN